MEDLIAINKTKPKILVIDVVLLDTTAGPSLQWVMGIFPVHAGTDGILRVTTTINVDKRPLTSEELLF